MNNIEELNRLIQESKDISGIKDNKLEFSKIIEELFSSAEYLELREKQNKLFYDSFITGNNIVVSRTILETVDKIITNGR